MAFVSLLQVENILHQLESDYRNSVLSLFADLGQTIPPGVDPLDIQLPDQIDMESSDAGTVEQDFDMYHALCTMT